MTANDFYLNYNVTGPERKQLVQAIAACTGADAKYLGAPTFAYRVDYFTIDRNGVVSFDDRADSEEIEGLIETLAQQGFVAQTSALEHANNEVPAEEAGGAPAPDKTAQTGDTLAVQIPAADLSPEALNNLNNLLAAKGRLIRKALGAAELPVNVDAEKVSFPWFSADATGEDVKAYTHLVTALCGMARNQKRISAKEKTADNDKYAFRCFLLRLGFIGAEFKEERKILLKNLSGNSSWKNGAPAKEESECGE